MIITAQAKALGMQAKCVDGLSEPSRLAIREALRDGPLSVTAIVESTGLGQPSASGHLGCLHDCGLVSREQKGRFVFYALSDERVGVLLATAAELLFDVAKDVYECVRYNRPAVG